MDWIAPFSTLLAALGGYALAGWNDARRDERASKREEAAEARARDARRRDFQLQTLLELQNEARRLAQAALDVHIFHLAAGDDADPVEARVWGEHRARASGFELLLGRVVDDGLRQQGRKFIDACTDLADTRRKRADTDEETARIDRVVTAAAAIETATMEAIGAAIRRELAQGATPA
ncbi:hypothetical protein [Promicromonospora sp. NFX87]|uniref:hypothetical protein n=1 Tax=Promicromonospora sp. NFX87 TaxID=3402691 RepID=UPI003AFA90FD